MSKIQSQKQERRILLKYQSLLESNNEAAIF